MPQSPTPMRPFRFWLFFASLCLTAVAGFPRIAGAAPAPVPYDDRLDRDLAHAAEYGGEVVVPDGVNVITRPHIDNGISITGADEGSVIQVPSALPGPALTVRGNGADNTRPHLSNFRVIGPGRMALGRRTAGMNGIRIECQCQQDGVRVEQFDCGEDWASVGGHILCRACTFTGNYYNAFVSVGGGNYGLTDCYLDGAGRANIAMPYNVGIEGLSAPNTHLGFTTYGVYQEATPAGQQPSRIFLAGCDFRETSFEQVWQAVKSEFKGADGGPRCEFENNEFVNVGWSFCAAFAPAGANGPPAHQLEGDYMSGAFTYRGGDHPFGPGTAGVFGFARYNGVSGNAMMVPPAITIDGVTPSAMP